MSSRKRTGNSGLESRKELRSGSRNAAPSSSKLRMDSRPQQPRITDPSLPAGRRREIDTVMKKARSSPNSNGYWDKKLLEVEAKDPNRWRHSGYKAMYIGGSSSPSPARHAARRSRSRSRSHARRPRSPPHRAPRSPSSLSSCSDDSCSVCSPKTSSRPTPRDKRPTPRDNRSRSYSVPRSRAPRGSGGGSRRPRPPASPPSDPRRAAPRPRHDVIELSPDPPAATRPVPRPGARPVSAAAGSAAVGAGTQMRKKKDKVKEKDKQMMVTHIKTERTKPKRRRSPAAAESSGSEDSSSSSLSAVVASTRLTLSERFGKMAQWSVDRRDIENMRITKNSSSGDLKVMIEAEERMYDSPPLRYSHSPAPIGHYPDELLSTGPSGLTAWDDVRVRYQYYKDLGYLRDLTLDDYIKWEQWWYKYQEWLKNERYYEHWLSTQSRRRRKRLPATQRLN